MKYNGFDVGPVTVRTTVQPGEGYSEAYARARTAAYAMFEAEFKIKNKQYRDRLAEV